MEDKGASPKEGLDVGRTSLGLVSPRRPAPPSATCLDGRVRPLITLQGAEDPCGEGNLALGNLSSLVQARRKLKNFPTKTFTSRRDKKQLRVINLCQHSGPRGQAGGPEGDQRALRMRGVRGEILGHQDAQLFHKPLRSQGWNGCQGTPLGRQGLQGSWHPHTARQRGPGDVVHPEPRIHHCLSVFCRVAFFLEPSLGRFTEKEANHQGRRCKQLAGSLF